MDEENWRKIRHLFEAEFGLTPRIWDVCRLLMEEGASRVDIAERLGVSKTSAKTYLQRLYAALAVHSDREALAKAWALVSERGLLSEQQQHLMIEKTVDILVGRGLLPPVTKPAVTSSRRYLRGAEEVYEVSTEICRLMTKGIKTVIYGRSAKAPSSWPQAVGQRLKETLDAGSPATYQCVIAFDFTAPPIGLKEGVDGRYAVYEQLGVRDQVSLYFMDDRHPPTGSDILIVDLNHVVVGVMTLPGSDILHDALYFEDARDAAVAFASWFDEVVLPASIPYEAWFKSHAAP